MGKVKGNSFERAVGKRLDAIFEPYCRGQKFKRVPSSGARTGGKNVANVKQMPPSAVRTLTSDLIVPENFTFSIECKSYKHIDLYPLLVGSAKKHPIIQWMRQLHTGLTAELRDITGFEGGFLVMKGNSMPWLIAALATDISNNDVTLPSQMVIRTTEFQDMFASPFVDIIVAPFEEFFSYKSHILMCLSNASQFL